MRRLAYGTGALGVALFVLIIAFGIAGAQASRLITAVPYLAVPLVGLVVARREPRNVVAWAFLGSSVLLGLDSLGATLAHYGFEHGWPDRDVHLAIWINWWTWFPGLCLVAVIGLAHFPDGRLSPRWRALDAAALTVMAGFGVGVGVSAWSLSSAAMLADRSPRPVGWRRAVFDAGFSCFPLIVPCVLAAVVSLALRWRRSGTLGRHQIRWVAAAGVVAIVAEALGSVPGVAIPIAVQSSAFALVAVATGVAILRYRLYEIDRLISRTLGWGLVTALLVAVYLAIAAAGAAVIPARYGSVGVVAATLAAAALFVPVRRRIQHTVDRRFDRARYDAARIIDTFASRVRAHVDAAALDDELLHTVQAAVAPASASVWLAGTGR